MKTARLGGSGPMMISPDSTKTEESVSHPPTRLHFAEQGTVPPEERGYRKVIPKVGSPYWSLAIPPAAGGAQ